MKAIEHYQLPITRWAFSGGEPLDAFDIDLFLSKDEKEVQKVIDKSNCATTLIYDSPTQSPKLVVVRQCKKPISQAHLVFADTQCQS